MFTSSAEQLYKMICPLFFSAHSIRLGQRTIGGCRTQDELELTDLCSCESRKWWHVLIENEVYLLGTIDRSDGSQLFLTYHLEDLYKST